MAVMTGKSDDAATLPIVMASNSRALNGEHHLRAFMTWRASAISSIHLRLKYVN